MKSDQQLFIECIAKPLLQEIAAKLGITANLINDENVSWNFHSAKQDYLEWQRLHDSYMWN